MARKINGRTSVETPAGYKTQRPAAKSNQIRNWRLFRGIKTQVEMAELSGIARPQISNLECGIQEYKQSHLEALAKVLDCTPAALLSINPLEPREYSLEQIHKLLVKIKLVLEEYQEGSL